MVRSLKITPLLALALNAATPALAGDGFYGGAALGLIEGADSSASGTSGGTVDFDNGMVAAVFIGKRFDGNWRGEAELSRRGLNLSTVSGANASGNAKATSLMGNALYDIGTEAPIQPYIGAGLGFAKVAMDGAAPFGGSSINDSDTVGAFQAIAGASYALNDRIGLFADYRYFTTADADFTTGAGAATSMNISTHSVMAGLRFQFGTTDMSASANMKATAKTVSTATAEPPVRQQASMPAQTLPDTYMVYFTLNKATVTPDAVSVIEQAAANAKSQNITRLVLTGHTDRAGDESYNQSLSKQRAEAVKAAFVALGFDPSEIVVKAKGETSLLVPTDDGKHEPKNRRVEIVLP